MELLSIQWDQKREPIGSESVQPSRALLLSLYTALKIFVHRESAIFLKEGGVIFFTARKQKFQGTKKTQASPSFTLLFSQNAMPGTN